MQRESVGSSAVVSIGYDASTQTLEVEFIHGGVYQYYNVSSGVYDALMSAASKGQFIASQVKDRFPFARVG
jgi:hypothetical protein